MNRYQLLLVGSLLIPSSLFAQVIPEPMGEVSATRQRAAMIYQRLTGTKAPLDAPILKQMEARIKANDAIGAADLAVREPAFYNITVKQFAARMSTRDESISAGLNDFVATLVGIVRDDRSAKEMLTGSYIYVPSPATQALPEFNINNRIDTMVKLDNNLLRSNNVYGEMDSKRLDLMTGLSIRQGQPILVVRGDDKGTADVGDDLQPVVRDNPDAAGLLSTRAFAGSHAVAGTNRRMVQFSFRQFLCIDIKQWADSSAPDNRIGRDVDRAPGGDPAFFLTTCKACHSVMDSFRGAFASLDFDAGERARLKQYVFADQQDAQRTVAGSVVASKYANGSGAFPSGWITSDASWVNNANQGTNAEFFGWRGNAMGGTGAKAFGQLLADSQAFSRCMVQRVYRSTCRREIASSETELLNSETRKFEQDYNLKNLFKRVAVNPDCIGNN